MDENLHKAKELLRKYREGTCTPKEKAWVESWYARLNDEPTDLTDSELADDLASLKTKLDGIHRSGTYKWTTFRTVAAILVTFLSIAISLYWYSGEHSQPNELASQQPNDIPPGGNRAMLTFSDGSSINLDENKSGIVVGDSLTYDDGTAIPVEKETKYATITTPNGGQYQVTLPDGSKVWLNAASSLRYPMEFTGGQRKVVFEGEGYFDITADEKHPFIVQTPTQEITVLGTEFNVIAYGNEPASSTTLVEGSVSVSQVSTDEKTVIKPGQQAISTGGRLTVATVNVGDYTAWKDGLLMLNNADLPAVARQVERWYDVEFVMGPQQTGGTLSGILPRDVNLSEVLAGLQFHTGLQFKLEGRRIMVSK